MPVEHWDGDDVQVDQDAAITESHTHVKEPLAAMRTVVTRERKFSDGSVTHEDRNLLRV